MAYTFGFFSDPALTTKQAALSLSTLVDVDRVVGVYLGSRATDRALQAAGGGAIKVMASGLSVALAATGPWSASVDLADHLVGGVANAVPLYIKAGQVAPGSYQGMLSIDAVEVDHVNP